MKKKSLISTLKTVKKANVAAGAKNEGSTTRKVISQRYSRYANLKMGKGS